LQTKTVADPFFHVLGQFVTDLLGSYPFALGLAQSIGQNRAKHLKVNVLGQLFQGSRRRLNAARRLLSSKKETWNVFMQ
jgi:hypothetical protein